MANPYKKLKDLLPQQPLLVGEVLAHLTGNRSSIQLPSGALVVVRGQSVAVGNNAFIRNGVVEGAAANLGYFVIDV